MIYYKININVLFHKDEKKKGVKMDSERKTNHL